MGLFDALVTIATAPIMVAGQIVSDVSGDTDDEGLWIPTCGISSVVKGIGKTIEKAIDDLDK